MVKCKNCGVFIYQSTHGCFTDFKQRKRIYLGIKERVILEIDFNKENYPMIYTVFGLFVVPVDLPSFLAVA